MDLKEIYSNMQGDYESVINRLSMDTIIVKFLKKFAESGMDDTILAALERNDFEEAFRESHNLKGVCANLSLSKLEHSASELTEALRHGEPTIDIAPLVEALKEDYKLTKDEISKLD